MAGHSKFKNIMHRKGAQDKKRAKMFTKLAREIYVAVKSGIADQASNPKLRAAIAAARSVNMPKDRIEAAIAKASNAADIDNFEEIRYEGYGPGGAALIVEALTDNRNRTASIVRSAFTKHAGALGETGSVSFMFTRVGAVVYSANSGSIDEFFNIAAEAGADDIISDAEEHEILCSPEKFYAVREELGKKFGAPISAELTWKPNNIVELTIENAETVLKLVEALEDSDDVQNVVGNFVIPEEVSYKLYGKG